MSENISTEEIIKNTAKQLFFVEGNFNATTQEIALRAGVNRTLLHYYFRSKDELFSVVYSETVQEKLLQLFDTFASKDDFEKKLENIIDITSGYLQKYPYAQIYLLNELNKTGENRNKIIFQKKNFKSLHSFLLQIEYKINEGVLVASSPKEFMINLLSLISYPILMKDFFCEIYEINEKQMCEFYKKRKSRILSLLLKK